MEIYRDIEGYEGLYQISDQGNVKSLKFGKERTLKQGKNVYGYSFVVLCKNGNKKLYLVHRLVAQAFIPNPTNLPQVNHKDEDKTNNTVDNLEYCDCKYNINYGKHNEKMAKSHINHPSYSIPVLCIETDIVYPSIKEAQRQLGIYATHINACCLGKRKTCGGYHWQYVEKKKEVV